MTSIDTNPLNRIVADFKKLPVDDQIAALGSMYQSIAGSLPSVASPTRGSNDVEQVVEQVLEMREGGQIEFLQDILSDSDRDEVALDINPSKAMLELIPGDGIEPPIEQYENLDANERLMVWYRLASEMGDKFITLPSDYQWSDAAKAMMNSLSSLSADDKIGFLSQIV
jgi:hypothetical protein